ncbi:MAG TPA: VOC family protein [Vicinamibacteria bacterium]|nr:VOC family protein [Vicinamibacteria bacterium]
MTVLSEIGQIAVTAKDIDRAVAFYRDKLGMKFLFQAPPQLGFFSCGSVRLMLAVPGETEHDHPASVIYYRVPDVQVAYRELSSRGVSFTREPAVVHRTDEYELWIAPFEDSEGNTLALMCEKAR